MVSKDVFTAFSPTEKKHFLDLYMRHHYRRNGDLDLTNKTFSIRDAYFVQLEATPVHFKRPLTVDRETFHHNEGKWQLDQNLDELTLWALAVAKANRSERDAAEYALAHIDYTKRAQDDPLSYIEVEELYHTRILRNILGTLNLESRELPPHPLTQAISRTMIYAPKPIANMMILCAEITGVAAFSLLADKAKTLFADQSEPLERVEELFQQILVDEVGHVHYARSQLGQTQLDLARVMLPAFSHYFTRDIPEFGKLFGKERFKETVVAASVDDVVAHYEDKFVF